MKPFNLSFNIPSPCKECDKRYVGCHGECQDYLDYRMEMDSRREDYQDRQKKEMDIAAVRTKGISKKRLSGRSER